MRTTQVHARDDFIDLGIGQPNPELLPLEIVQRATAHRLAEGDTSLLGYGYEQGDGYFRRALASFLTQGYGVDVDPATLFVTAGASQALDLVCTLFTRPGDTVLVEEPTYFLALRIFRDHGLRIVGVDQDEKGVRPDSLEQTLVDHKPAFLYTIPTFQNPTGATLTGDRRRQLIAASQQHNLLIVADEVYQLLNYGQAPPRPLAASIAEARLLSLGSFSKILAPGLRLGWIQAQPSLLKPLTGSGLVESGGSLNHFMANIVRVLLDEGWQDRYLTQLRQAYVERVRAMDASLSSQLRDYATYRAPNGGFFFWLSLRRGLNAATLRQFAGRHGVGLREGALFSSRDALRNCFRLSFAYYDEASISEGVRRLSQALREVTVKNG